MDKGIIASPFKVDFQGGEFSFSTVISGERLRYYLLYWNEVVIPTNNLIHIGVDPNEDLLISQGILKRPSVSLPQIGGDGGKSLLQSQAIVAEALMGMEPGKWVFMQEGDKLNLTEEHSEVRSNITLDIANIMPVPPIDTPIEDILEFKLARKDELKELWHYLDDLCIQVQREPDRALAQRLITHNFGKAVENSIKVTKEKWRGFHLTNFKPTVSLDYKNLVGGGAAEVLASYLPILDSVPKGVAAIFGVAITTLKVSADISLTPRVPKTKDQLKLSYLSEITKRLY
ncbi:MAG: DUF6236 family protein [Colwellia sp.]|nr:DUF6236 family protein [Colwellia sp.]